MKSPTRPNKCKICGKIIRRAKSGMCAYCYVKEHRKKRSVIKLKEKSK